MSMCNLLDHSDLISVVVPVYNVELYLAQCINSILSQTYKNLEIILIDDGSTDSSPQICDEFALEDGRIKVIHQKNGGLSDARNTGISLCTGKYIAFIDSDDFVDYEYFSFLHRLIRSGEYQISICNPYPFKNEKDIAYRPMKETIKEMNGTEALEIMLYQRHFDTSAWGKLFLRELFSNIRFPTGKIFEDMGTIYKTLLVSSNVIFSNKELYFYRQRTSSISGGYYNKRKADYLKFAEEIYEKVSNEYISLIPAAASRCVSVASQLMSQAVEYGDDDDAKIYYKKICQYRKGLLCNKHVRFKNRVAVVLSYLGYTAFSHALKLFL